MWRLPIAIHSSAAAVPISPVVTPTTSAPSLSSPSPYHKHKVFKEQLLNNHIEYDLDDCDKAWLDLLNENLPSPISEDLLELVIDRIEKEWFDLTKDLSKQVTHEDTPCAICNDGDCENSNAIVFCDGCNLAVHQSCYGIPYIPEGQWLCRKCMVSPAEKVTCCFCPFDSSFTLQHQTNGSSGKGGDLIACIQNDPKMMINAFKQTVNSTWCHLLCALYIPEIRCDNTVIMEPVAGLESIPKSRWNLLCYICKQKQGACIQCDVKTCYTAFHPTCARVSGLAMSMKEGVKAWCDKHTPKDNVPPKNFDEMSTMIQSYLLNNKKQNTLSSSSPKKKSKKEPLSNPVLPHYIYSKLVTRFITNRNSSSSSANNHNTTRSLGVHVSSIATDALTADVLVKICKYWSLKRTHVPLLKRLHIEPWTHTPTKTLLLDSKVQKQYENLNILRKDLERARLLCELVRKREKEKKKKILVISKIVELCCLVLQDGLGRAMEDIKLMDEHQIFHNPVTPEIAPDYRDIIEHPMDFFTMEKKIENWEYANFNEFKADIELIIENCLTYNSIETVYPHLARNFEAKVKPYLEKLEHQFIKSGISPNGDATIKIDQDDEKIYSYGESIARFTREIGRDEIDSWFSCPTFSDFSSDEIMNSKVSVGPHRKTSNAFKGVVAGFGIDKVDKSEKVLERGPGGRFVKKGEGEVSPQRGRQRKEEEIVEDSERSVKREKLEEEVSVVPTTPPASGRRGRPRKSIDIPPSSLVISETAVDIEGSEEKESEPTTPSKKARPGRPRKVISQVDQTISVIKVENDLMRNTRSLSKRGRPKRR
ncbi:nuA3 HAT complex component nto1 [Nowakowskiella sp. JEL0407]|nr:nuA3 HAT complex component nto1 [Nowakowskiella sp. JEL0407]